MPRKTAVALSLLTPLVAVLLWGGPGVKAPVPAVTLYRVVDGDTAYVFYQHPTPVHTKLRFLRIDTPERKQPLYKEATEALKMLITGKVLRLEFEGEKYETDRYGRALVYVFAGDLNVNVEMVRLGWSKHYVKYGTGKYKALFEAAEKEAREAKRGLWK